MSFLPRAALLVSFVCTVHCLNSIIFGSKCNVFLRFRRSNRTKFDQELVYYSDAYRKCVILSTTFELTHQSLITASLMTLTIGPLLGIKLAT